MKRLLVMGIALILLLALANCGEHPGDAAQASTTNPEIGENLSGEQSDEELSVLRDNLISCASEQTLSFASLEELLEAHKSAITGKSAGKLAESVNFAELERFYLPISLPEPYQLRSISVAKNSVSIRYFHEEDTIRDAISNMHDFSFIFNRPDSDSTMGGVMQQYGTHTHKHTEEDLIDGKYLFCEPYMLYWELDGRLMSLKVPTSLEVLVNEVSLVEYLRLNSIEELARFTEVEVIELD